MQIQGILGQDTVLPYILWLGGYNIYILFLCCLVFSIAIFSIEIVEGAASVARFPIYEVIQAFATGYSFQSKRDVHFSAIPGSGNTNALICPFLLRACCPT
jgi:hypothetical protein